MSYGHKIDYFKLKRFLTTAMNNLYDLDEALFRGPLQKLRIDVFEQFEYYTKFAALNVKNIFESEFLTTLPVYVSNKQKLEKYEAGKIIFLEGEHGDNMYMILRGEVSISYEGVLLATLTSGDIIGEMSLLDSQPRSATAMALADVSLLCVSKENFLPLVKNSDEFTIRLLSSFSNRIRVQNRIISELTQHSC